MDPVQQEEKLLKQFESVMLSMVLKQMRQSWKRRRKARGRPQRWHRLYLRTANLGVRLHFAIIDFFAMV